MASVRFVAIGDSFTEGVGDELPDGRVRGWADLVAQGWADASAEPIEYANLAIRGRLVWPIVEEQLEPALALKPTHLSFNGGGNDMLRPRTSVARVVDAFSHVLRALRRGGRAAHPALGRQSLGSASARPGVPAPRRPADRGRHPRRSPIGPTSSARSTGRIANSSTAAYWSEDRLHMSARGHHRVAARVLTALGMEPPTDVVVAADAARRVGARSRVLPRARRPVGAPPPHRHVVGRRARSRSTRRGRRSSRRRTDELMPRAASPVAAHRVDELGELPGLPHRLEVEPIRLEPAGEERPSRRRG